MAWLCAWRAQGSGKEPPHLAWTKWCRRSMVPGMATHYGIMNRDYSQREHQVVEATLHLPGASSPQVILCEGVKAPSAESPLFTLTGIKVDREGGWVSPEPDEQTFANVPASFKRLPAPEGWYSR